MIVKNNKYQKEWHNATKPLTFRNCWEESFRKELGRKNYLGAKKTS
jgi:hypothetical protein